MDPDIEKSTAVRNSYGVDRSSCRATQLERNARQVPRDFVAQVCDNGGVRKVEGSTEAATSMDPVDQNPDSDPGEVELSVSIFERPTKSELRDQAISLLDAVRAQYEASRINRIRYMRLARQYGMTHADIGEHVGMTEAGVRMALRRAGDDL